MDASARIERRLPHHPYFSLLVHHVLPGIDVIAVDEEVKLEGLAEDDEVVLGFLEVSPGFEFNEVAVDFLELTDLPAQAADEDREVAEEARSP